MFFISKIFTTAPDKFNTPLQEKIYQLLQKLQIPFWRVNEEWYGCSDGTTTGYLKVRTEQIVHQFLPDTHHMPIFIEV